MNATVKKMKKKVEPKKHNQTFPKNQYENLLNELLTYGYWNKLVIEMVE